MMAAEKDTQAPATVTLEHVNAAPAQTWNRLRANDVTLTVPVRPRKGDVYFALPQLFDRVECGMGPDVTAWAVSQAAGARYVEVRGDRRADPVVVEVDAASGQVTDTGVMVREGSDATIVVAVGAGAAPAQPGGEAEAPATSASLLRVIAEARTHVRIVEVIGIGAGQQHLESVGISADEDAHVEVSQYSLGSGTVAVGLACDLFGTRSRLDLGCRYFASGSDVLDVNHVARLRGRGTRAEIAESGVLDGAARKALRATIDLVHGAKGARGNEAETVLVLSDDVTNKTLPTILCDEDDVAGNHGATIGSVSPAQLAYLEDRGLDRAQAEGLFVRALFEDAIMHAPEAASRAAAVAAATRVLGPETAHDFDGASADAPEEVA